MNLIISERIQKSKIKTDWDNYYWVIYVTNNKKQLYFKHCNKMFELKPFLESLMKRFEITDIRCIHSTPECVKSLGLPVTNMNLKRGQNSKNIL
jgi:hypothetical protein